MKAIEKLVEIASTPFSNQQPDADVIVGKLPLNHPELRQLAGLLQKKNGFVALENSLLLFGTERTKGVSGLSEWNDLNGWKRYYGENVVETVFFAEDVFGNQFGVNRNSIVRLAPESGGVTEHSKSIDQWAAKILENYDFETGWSVAHEWQQRNGPLPSGYLLLGRKPFVLGGDYVADNLVAVDGMAAMEKLGALYQQIRSVPDGKKVTVRGWV